MSVRWLLAVSLVVLVALVASATVIARPGGQICTSSAWFQDGVMRQTGVECSKGGG